MKNILLIPSQKRSALQWEDDDMPITYSVYCNNCKCATHYEEVAKGAFEVQPYHADALKNPPRMIYRFMRCSRCGVDFTFYMDYLGSQKYYPPREKLSYEPFDHLPGNLHQIYVEVYRNIYADNMLSAAMCIRSLVEGLCAAVGVVDGPRPKPKDGRENNLRGKIEGLLEKGIMNKSQAEALHSFRFMGNAATHELKSPKPEELSIAISILEAILRSTFELPEQIKGLMPKDD